MLRVVQVGPSVSIQDQGRPGHLRYGVTVSGAMDRTSYALANAALDNPPSYPAVEVSLGGITLVCEQGSLAMAVVGGDFAVQLNNEQLPPWSLFMLHTGDTLAIRPGAWGSWCYLAFAGQLNVNTWLGSCAVHLKSGVCGNALQAEELLQISRCRHVDKQVHALGNPDLLLPDSTIRAVAGPQDRYFEPQTLSKLFSESFTISADYDRMGMRLNGCKLPVSAPLDMPSEPILRGSIQVPGHGDPICLLADHHTAGGYPKIATVISADIDALSQHRTGQFIKFESLSPKEAVKAARERQTTTDQLFDHIMLNRTGLTARLWNNNLISGASDGVDDFSA